MGKVPDFETGKLTILSKLNDDETRNGKFCITPNDGPDYGGFLICVTIPARIMVAEVEEYSQEEDSSDI
jgi:hypothetical protein